MVNGSFDLGDVGAGIPLPAYNAPAANRLLFRMPTSSITYYLAPYILEYKLQYTNEEAFIIHKTDATTGDSLDGAMFALYSTSDCQESTKIAVSTSFGHGLYKIYVGPFASKAKITLYLKETKAPLGYALDPTIYEVEIPRITVGTNPTILGKELDSVTGYYTFTNEPLDKNSVSFQITKLDASLRIPLLHAEFALFESEDSDTPIATSVELGEGKYQLSGDMPAGTYYLRETKTPDCELFLADGSPASYVPDERALPVTVDASGTVTIPDLWQGENGSYHFYNVVDSFLPLGTGKVVTDFGPAPEEYVRDAEFWFWMMLELNPDITGDSIRMYGIKLVLDEERGTWEMARDGDGNLIRVPLDFAYREVDFYELPGRHGTAIVDGLGIAGFNGLSAKFPLRHGEGILLYIPRTWAEGTTHYEETDGAFGNGLIGEVFGKDSDAFISADEVLDNGFTFSEFSYGYVNEENADVALPIYSYTLSLEPLIPNSPLIPSPPKSEVDCLDKDAAYIKVIKNVYCKYNTMTLRKTDSETGKSLSGAAFSLYSDKTCAPETKVADSIEMGDGLYRLALNQIAGPISNSLSDETNIQNIASGLAKRDYYLKETNAPKHYVQDDAIYDVILKTEGILSQAVLTTTTLTEEGGVYLFPNKIIALPDSDLLLTKQVDGVGFDKNRLFQFRLSLDSSNLVTSSTEPVPPGPPESPESIGIGNSLLPVSSGGALPEILSFTADKVALDIGGTWQNVTASGGGTEQVEVIFRLQSDETYQADISLRHGEGLRLHVPSGTFEYNEMHLEVWEVTDGNAEKLQTDFGDGYTFGRIEGSTGTLAENDASLTVDGPGIELHFCNLYEPLDRPMLPDAGGEGLVRVAAAAGTASVLACWLLLRRRNGFQE